MIVSGAHLDPNFGETISEIKNDGFAIHDTVAIDLPSSGDNRISYAIGSGIISISESLIKIQPDIFVVYADRFEGLAAIIASTQMNIATAHIEGGDITEGGALDDSVRHAMTKLAHIHFTTNQQASNRLLGMGEAPWRVHTVGFPAIDLIKESNFASKQEIINKFNLKPDFPLVLFTQHSVTTEYKQAIDQLKPSLNALNNIAKDSGAQVILTFPNNDAGGAEIVNEIKKMDFHKNVQIHSSIGRYYYHGILSLAKDSDFKVVCVGNSSSGIKETPAFGCPTVNIGSRQKSRLRASNVIDVKYNEKEILKGLKTCLYDDKFIEICRNCENPYGIGDAGIKIADILSKIDLEKELILRKEMTLAGIANDGMFC